MNWGSAEAFWAMGGYGLYVWGSFAMAGAIMLIEPWLAARRHATARREALHSQEHTQP
jgi:heme exporter protein D